MKRILIIFCLVCFSAYSFAQQTGIDGFKLGSSREDAYWNVAVLNKNKFNGNLKFNTQGDNWVRYSTTFVSYTLYFSNDKLIKVTKSANSYNPNTFQGFINEQYLDIAYEFGNPTMSGDSYALWRGNNYKISFNYSITSEQYESLDAYSILGPSRPPITRYTCNVIIILELP